MTEWNIDQYNDPCRYDDCSNEIPWGIQDVSRDAHKFEGIIITLDGQKHEIPIGGGIVRSSSAQRVSTWVWKAKHNGSIPMYEMIDRMLMDAREEITDHIFKDNVIIARLNQQRTIPPEMPEGLIYARSIYDLKTTKF